MRRAICLAALGAAWLAAGCGQKGPLYLPDKNTRAVTTPAPQPAPAESAAPAPASPPAAQPKPTDQNNEDSGGP
jgi:predicted small lipoprotein YifL